jgi:hypothetical protein
MKFLASRFSAIGKPCFESVVTLKRRLCRATNAVLAHQPLDALLAVCEAPQPQFTHHSRAAVNTFEFGMNGAYYRQRLGVRQALARRRAAALPRPEAADADVEYRAHLRQHKRLALRVNSGVLHRTSLAQYAAAFFMISFSRFKRATSARRRDSSIASGVTALLPAAASLPAAAALIQLRYVWSIKPSSLTTSEMACPSAIRLTAITLNSVVYACFGFFFILDSSKVTLF